MPFIILYLYLSCADAGSLSDIAPSLAASSFEEDMLQDDIPNNTEFVAKSAGIRHNGTASNAPGRKPKCDTDRIRILPGESFALYRDYMAELEDTRAKNVASRQVLKSASIAHDAYALDPSFQLLAFGRRRIFNRYKNILV